MIEIKKVVKEGFEGEFESLMLKKSTLSSEKEEALQKAILEVEERFKDRENLIENLLSMISDEVEVETPDSEEEVEAEAEEAEGEAEKDGPEVDYIKQTEEEIEADVAEEETVEVPQVEQPGVVVDPYRIRI